MPECAFLSFSPAPAPATFQPECPTARPLANIDTAYPAAGDFTSCLRKVSEKQLPAKREAINGAKGPLPESFPENIAAADGRITAQNTKNTLLHFSPRQERNKLQENREEESDETEFFCRKTEESDRQPDSLSVERETAQEKAPLFPATETTGTVASQRQFPQTKQSQKNSRQEISSAEELPSSSKILRSKGGLISFSLSTIQPKTAQERGVFAAEWQGENASVNRLQRIIDTADGTGTVTIAITKESVVLQEPAVLEKIGWLPSVATSIPARGDSLSSGTINANMELFKILDNKVDDKTMQQRPALWPQPEEGETEGNSVSGNTVTKPYPLQQGDINSQSGKTLSIDRELLKNQAKTVIPAEAGNRVTITDNQKQQPEFHSGGSTMPKSFSVKNTEGSLFLSDAVSSGALFLSAAQSQFSETPANPAPSITLSSGMMVTENEVIRQFIDRFQVNGRNLESRINIRLNPAELGEIEITLSIKEKTIKANVVAQSRITQGILENNLDRIKNTLERQGFTIAKFNITADDYLSAEFDLFERESARRQQDSFPRNQSGNSLHRQAEMAQETYREKSGIDITI